MAQTGVKYGGNWYIQSLIVILILLTGSNFFSILMSLFGGPILPLVRSIIGFLINGFVLIAIARHHKSIGKIIRGWAILIGLSGVSTIISTFVIAGLNFISFFILAYGGILLVIAAVYYISSDEYIIPIYDNN